MALAPTRRRRRRMLAAARRRGRRMLAPARRRRRRLLTSAGRFRAADRDAGLPVLLLRRLTRVGVVRITLVGIAEVPGTQVLDVRLVRDRPDLHLLLPAGVALGLPGRAVTTTAVAERDARLPVLLLRRLTRVGVVRITLVGIAEVPGTQVLDVRLVRDRRDLHLLLPAGVALGLPGRAVTTTAAA